MTDEYGEDMLSAEYSKAQDVLKVVQKLVGEFGETSQKLQAEADENQRIKDRIQFLEDDQARLGKSIEGEKEEHEKTKGRMAEVQTFHEKSAAALKAMTADLLTVRQQNEALTAEMEVQRKAFVVSADWAQLHQELKGKYIELANEHEKLQAQLSAVKEAMEAAQTQAKDAHDSNDALDDAIRQAKLEIKQADDFLKCKVLQDELIAELGSYDELKKMMGNAKELHQRQREKARAAMEKSLAANDDLLNDMVFNAWKKLAQDAVLKKNKKEQSTAMALRKIANSDTATMDFCITAWHKEMEEAKREKLIQATRELEQNSAKRGAQMEAARRNALAQLEKQFGNESKALLREVLGKWQIVRENRIRREGAKKKAERALAGSGQALLVHVLGGWKGIWSEAKLKRQRKAQSKARAMRMIANGDNALQDFCLTQWHEITKTAVASKKAKVGSHEQVLRMLASSDGAIVKFSFMGWADVVKQRAEKNQKMKAVQRGLISSDLGIQDYVLTQWHIHMQKMSKNKLKKHANMKRGLREIDKRNGNILLEVVMEWSKYAAANRQNLLKEQEAAKLAEPPEESEETKANKILIEALKAQIADLRIQVDPLKDRLNLIHNELDEKKDRCKKVDEQLASSDKELVASRKKAKEINDELTRVSQFLQRPRRPASRPASGKTAKEQLPPIGQKPPNSARGAANGGGLYGSGSEKQADAAYAAPASAWAEG